MLEINGAYFPGDKNLQSPIIIQQRKNRFF